MEKYNVIGIMSGTSLDGLDIAFCTFIHENNSWQYTINKAETINYTKKIQNKLTSCLKYETLDFLHFNNYYGIYIGRKINQFAKKHNLSIDFIASHGHTIFHTPEKKLTFQLGNGAYIAAETGITTISDFRTFDVALNGQGAPLVPIGDEFLFNDYSNCLNLGGFSNVSFQKRNKRIAFDICPVNIAINHYTQQMKREFDKDGNIAKGGKINTELLGELNNIDFYTKKPPKSLSKEWLDEIFIPIVEKYSIPIKDKLRTIYEHIAIQLAKILIQKNTLVTGGGAFNSFLIELIIQKSKSKIIIPDKKTIDFKEALIFAFLGVLRYRNEINCLQSVTGAKTDNIGGIIHKIK
jgi:anhydro-N-acetylmuramic acid kinase